MKKLFLFLSISLISISKMHALTILPPTHNLGGDIGAALGAGIARGMEMASQERYEIERMEKAKKRAEEERYIAVRNQIYIEQMLESYTTTRHQEFVNCIWKSKLPKDQKLLIINHFEKIRKGMSP